MNTKKMVFSGCATAIVTPFKDSEIDFYALGVLIERQIEAGVSAIVLLGTTGESPTISKSEREKIIAYAREKIGTRVPLIVGAGANCTKDAIKKTKIAERLGADAVLSVTPYYNKATDRGVAEHYLRIADSTELPIILYNVPSRTGLKLSCATLELLKDVQSIVAIKEASGDVSEIEGKIARFGDYFHFYSGCDELVLPIYSLGGRGVISAASNVIPKEMATLCALFEQNDVVSATALALKIEPVIRELFAEVNPIPAKGALSLMGLCENELRLPLTPSTRLPELKDVLARAGVI